MLQNALLRNVRFISAIGLHTREMPVLQSQQMFERQAFADAGNAKQQTRTMMAGALTAASPWDNVAPS